MEVYEKCRFWQRYPLFRFYVIASADVMAKLMAALTARNEHELARLREDGWKGGSGIMMGCLFAQIYHRVFNSPL